MSRRVGAVPQEESGRILGRVVTQDGAPAAGVRVEAQGPSLLGPRRETTDARGHYRVVGVPVGSYRLRLSLIGYRPVAVDSVTVMLGRVTTLGDVVLQPQAVELGEIVVTAEQTLAVRRRARAGRRHFVGERARYAIGRPWRSLQVS